jgi:hypothetical protein
VVKKIGLAVMLAALSGVASAKDSCKIEYFLWFPIEVCAHDHDGRGSSPTRAPEIDPASTLAGLTLALGGLAVLRGRRYSKNPKA